MVDSFHEIERLAAVTAELGSTAPVMVRVTAGVEAHTHEYIATAHEDQKFGFSITSGDALDAVRRVQEAPGLELLGLHSHIGSQIFDTAGFEVAARRVLALHAQVSAELGVSMPQLDLGGGFGIAYTTQDDPADPAQLATELTKIVEHECRALDVPVPHLSIEPGRAIVGPAMCTVYEVGTVKEVGLDAGATRTYVSVDGGMSDNIRTALYDADYSCTLASRHSDAAPVLGRVVGKHCEAGDIVVKDEFLPGDVAPGRPARRAGDGRLLPLDGQQLQPRAPAAGGRGPRRGEHGRGPPRDGGRSPADRRRRLSISAADDEDDAHDRPERMTTWTGSRPAAQARTARLRLRRQPGRPAAARAGRRPDRAGGRADRAGRGRRTPARAAARQSRSRASCSPPTPRRWSPATTSTWWSR